MRRLADAPTFMTPAEVARIFRVDPRTVSRWAAAGRLPAQKTPGGHYRFRQEDIESLLAETIVEF